MQAYESGGISVLIINIGTRWIRMVPAALTPKKELDICIKEPVARLTISEKKFSPVLTRNATTINGV
jgi:hypothetical protein